MPYIICIGAHRCYNGHVNITYSIDELLHFLGGDPQLATQRVRQALGLNAQRWERFCREGLDERMADLVATRLGYHPNQIWEGWDRPIMTTSRPQPTAPAGRKRSPQMHKVKEIFLQAKPDEYLCAADIAHMLGVQPYGLTAALNSLAKRGLLSTRKTGRVTMYMKTERLQEDVDSTATAPNEAAIKIYQYLTTQAGQWLSVQDIAEALDTSVFSLTARLATLRKQGLVEAQKVGRTRGGTLWRAALVQPPAS